MRVTGAEIGHAPHCPPHSVPLDILGLTGHSQNGSVASYFHIQEALAAFMWEGYKGMSLVIVRGEGQIDVGGVTGEVQGLICVGVVTAQVELDMWVWAGLC